MTYRTMHPTDYMQNGSKNKPVLLIITGPQGSGNHLFSKIFSYHKDVYGWNALYKNKWVGHDQEVFQPYWLEPKKLSGFDWTQSKYFVTSISCPFVLNKKFTTPKYHTFVKQAKKYATVKIAIIGRDKNIIKQQQLRVRKGEHTAPVALQHLRLLDNAFYLSHELFFLYGIDYVKSIAKQLDFPISTGSYVKGLLKEESNKKYVKYAKKGKFDNYQFKINY